MTVANSNSALPIRALSPDESRQRSLRYLLQANARLLSVNDFRKDEEARSRLKDFCNELQITAVDDSWEIAFRSEKVFEPRRSFRFYTTRRNSASDERPAAAESQQNAELARTIVITLCGLDETKAVEDGPKSSRFSTPSLVLASFLGLLALFPELIGAALFLGAYAFSRNSPYPIQWMLSGALASGVFFAQIFRGDVGSEVTIFSSFVLVVLGFVVVAEKATDLKNLIAAKDLPAKGLLFLVAPALVILLFFRTDLIHSFVAIASLVLVVLHGIARLMGRSLSVMVSPFILSISSGVALLLGGSDIVSSFQTSSLNLFVLAGALASLLFFLSLTIFWGSFSPSTRLSLMLTVPLFFLGTPYLWENLALSFLIGSAALGASIGLARLFASGFRLRAKRRGVTG